MQEVFREGGKRGSVSVKEPGEQVHSLILGHRRGGVASLDPACVAQTWLVWQTCPCGAATLEATFMNRSPESQATAATPDVLLRGGLLALPV